MRVKKEESEGTKKSETGNMVKFGVAGSVRVADYRYEDYELTVECVDAEI